MLILATLLACSDYKVVAREHFQDFSQEDPGQLDLLLVVDASTSMEDEQRSLGENFNGLVSWFDAAAIDYQIAVTTPDMQRSDAGEINGEIITPDTADAEGVFADAVAVGLEGSRFEQAFDAALEALSPVNLAGPNAGLLRDDAWLGVVFVSDEDDSSTYDVDTYVRAFQDLKSTLPRGSVILSAIGGDTPGGCDSQGEIAYPGWRYEQAVALTDGLFASICDDDFQGVVEDIGRRTSRQLDTFYLEEERFPLANTLEVWIDSVILEDGWHYSHEEHAILFETPPPPGAQITVRYDLSAATPTEDIYP